MNETLYAILVGGLLGILGQGIRAIVGMKKMRDAKVTNNVNQAKAASTNATNKANNNNEPPVVPVVVPDAEYDPKRFWMSIFIGFVAGALASLFTVKWPEGDPEKLKTVWLTIIGAGYAGTDFIEGLVRKAGIGNSGGSDPNGGGPNGGGGNSGGRGGNSGGGNKDEGEKK